MVKLVYTNSIKDNSPQPVPSLSIGGYMSSTQLRNDEINNLFGSTNRNKNIRRKKEYRLLALRNLSQFPIENITFKFSYDSDLGFGVKYAFILPSESDCGDLEFEILSNSNSKPSTVESFEEVVNDEVVTLSGVTLESMEGVGIWFERENKQENISIDCAEISPDIEPGFINKNEQLDFSLEINYQNVS